MDVAPPVLLKGAWYSLEQCGNLLRDAVILYQAKAYPSSVVLAMFGREELGKYRILLDEWRKAEKTGTCPSVAAIQAAFDDHVDKQRRALLSVSLMTEGPSRLDAALRAQMKHSPQDREYQEAEKVIRAALEAVAKRAPNDRHVARMKALYVDLQGSGADWNRPCSQISQADAKKFLGEAANDYAVQRDRVADLDQLRGIGDEQLAVALKTWPERPELPAPARTD